MLTNCFPDKYGEQDTQHVFFQSALDNHKKNKTAKLLTGWETRSNYGHFFAESRIANFFYMVVQYDCLKEALLRTVQTSDSDFITSTPLTLPENTFTVMSSHSCPGSSIAAVDQNRTQPLQAFYV